MFKKAIEEIDNACEKIMGHTNWSYFNDPNSIDFKKGDLCIIFHREKLEKNEVN